MGTTNNTDYAYLYRTSGRTRSAPRGSTAKTPTHEWNPGLTVGTDEPLTTANSDVHKKTGEKNIENANSSMEVWADNSKTNNPSSSYLDPDYMKNLLISQGLKSPTPTVVASPDLSAKVSTPYVPKETETTGDTLDVYGNTTGNATGNTTGIMGYQPLSRIESDPIIKQANEEYRKDHPSETPAAYQDGVTENPLAAYAESSDGTGEAASSEGDGKKESSSMPSLNYTGTDFKEWYRQNYGAEYNGETTFGLAEGMSYYDLLLGLSLFDNYNRANKIAEYETKERENINSLYGDGGEVATRNKDAYDASTAYQNDQYQLASDNISREYSSGQSRLEREREIARQNASVMLDKMNKYLPNQVKASGLQGQGISESTLLSGYANYASQMGNIDESHNNNSVALRNAYLASQGELDSQNLASLENYRRAYDTAENERISAYHSGNSELDEYVRNNTPNASDGVSDVLAAVYGENDTTAYNLSDQGMTNIRTAYEDILLGSIDGKISQADYDKLVELANVEGLGSYKALIDQVLNGIKPAIRSSEEQAKVDKDAADARKYGVNGIDGCEAVKPGVGNNIEVTYNGVKYEVQQGREVTDPVVISAAEKIINGGLFTYNNALYVKIDGEIHQVEKRTMQSRKDNPYLRLVKAITSEQQKGANEK